MKTLRNFALCAIVAIGFACNATAKQDDKQDKKENKEEKQKEEKQKEEKQKEEKQKEEKQKEEKIVVIDQILAVRRQISPSRFRIRVPHSPF